MSVARSVRAATMAMALLVSLPATTAVATEQTNPAEAVPQGAVDRLPDLVMARPYGWYLQAKSGGRTWLRFGTIAWNVGRGPLELRARRLQPTDDTMVVRQRIYDSQGGWRSRKTSSVMIFDQGDSHTHWHLWRFIRLRLYRAGQAEPHVYGARKLGYCLLDARRMKDPPPRSPASPRYPFDACGEPDSMTLLEGLSVGWGDDYPPNFAHQWMDITGLPPGRYRLCLTADARGEFKEVSETNNQRWVDVRISIPNDKVKVKATGTEPCGPGVF